MILVGLPRTPGSAFTARDAAKRGECVEIASAHGVMICDATNRDGGTLTFTAGASAVLADLTDIAPLLARITAV